MHHGIHCFCVKLRSSDKNKLKQMETMSQIKFKSCTSKCACSWQTQLQMQIHIVKEVPRVQNLTLCTGSKIKKQIHFGFTKNAINKHYEQKCGKTFYFAKPIFVVLPNDIGRLHDFS